MRSETRCHFVNPKYTEVDGSPCWPSLDALPERPDTVILAVNPLRAARFTQEAADAGVPSPGDPRRRRRGGRRGGGRRCSARSREIAIRHGIALLGPNCMGMVDWTTNSTNYIGDVNPWLPRGHVAALAQSGSVTDAFIHSPGTRIGYSRIVSVGAEAVLDVCDYLAYCLDDPETHAVMLFVEGFKRPGAVPRAGGPGPGDGQADPGRQGRPLAAGAGGGRRPQRQPGRRGPRDRRRARCGRRHPLRRPRRADRDGGARRRDGGWALDRAAWAAAGPAS